MAGKVIHPFTFYLLTANVFGHTSIIASFHPIWPFDANDGLSRDARIGNRKGYAQWPRLDIVRGALAIHDPHLRGIFTIGVWSPISASFSKSCIVVKFAFCNAGLVGEVAIAPSIYICCPLVGPSRRCNICCWIFRGICWCRHASARDGWKLRTISIGTAALTRIGSTASTTLRVRCALKSTCTIAFACCQNNRQDQENAR
mmetsp:Transcript_77185/g.121894  ORF Transcript_77185/g.121894 Transcript_77185/m.121894 type:complete len:201 (+) Transcript_77185:1078-1680(+)